MLRITVIGGGIIGLSSAYALSKEYDNAHITVMANGFSPNLVSDHAFGLVLNRSNKATDGPNVCRNVLKTIEHCSNFHPTTAEFAGIRKRGFFFLTNHETKEGLLKQIQPIEETLGTLRKVTTSELESLGFTCENKDLRLVFGDEKITKSSLHGFESSVYLIDTGKYLQWLLQELQSLAFRDGTCRFELQNRKVVSLNEVLSDCDLVVNCSGLGARELCNDVNVIPMRGQYLRVALQGLEHLIVANNTVLCPRHNDVCLGSLYQIGRTDTEVNDADTNDVLNRCSVLLPRVRKAEITKIAAGIRPGRIGGSRMELEWAEHNSDTTIPLRSVPVIHNYGHSGKGIAQHWGSALEVVNLSKLAFNRKAKL